MKKKILTLSLLLSAAVSLMACCGFEPHSLTELLLFDRYNRSVFQCRVYRSAADLTSGFFSDVKVEEVFKGKLDSNFVLVRTGGNSTAGGQYLKPYSDWLIFSAKSGDGSYNATVCDWFSCNSSDNPVKYFNTLQIISSYKKMTQNAGTGAIIWYYPDGVKAAEGRFLKGKPDGLWRHYRPDGTLKSEAHYKKGLLHGKYLEIYEQGRGREISIIKNGRLISKKSFYGQAPYRLQSSTKIQEKNGLKIISLKTWHPNGAPAQESITEQASAENISIYTFPGKTGRYSFRDSLGKIQEAGTYFYGAKTGAWIETDYSTGKTVSVEYGKPDVPGFDFYRFYENGQPQILGNLKNAKPEGLWTYYSEAGIRIKEVHFVDGQLSGEERKYDYKTGRAWGRGEYLNGKEHGEHVSFFEDGSLQSRSFYVNGIKQGEELLYTSPGQMRVKSNYKDGLLEGAYTGFDYLGDTSLVATFRRGALEGEARECSRELKHCVKLSGEYRNGFKTGTWRTFDCNGKQLQTCIFEENSHSGTYGSIYNGKCKPFE